MKKFRLAAGRLAAPSRPRRENDTFSEFRVTRLDNDVPCREKLKRRPFSAPFLQGPKLVLRFSQFFFYLSPFWRKNRGLKRWNLNRDTTLSNVLSEIYFFINMTVSRVNWFLYSRSVVDVDVDKFYEMPSNAFAIITLHRILVYISSYRHLVSRKVKAK